MHISSSLVKPISLFSRKFQDKLRRHDIFPNHCCFGHLKFHAVFSKPKTAAYTLIPFSHTTDFSGFNLRLNLPNVLYHHRHLCAHRLTQVKLEQAAVVGGWEACQTRTKY